MIRAGEHSLLKAHDICPSLLEELSHKPSAARVAEPPYVPGDALHGRECPPRAAGDIANNCTNSGILMSWVPAVPGRRKGGQERPPEMGIGSSRVGAPRVR